MGRKRDGDYRRWMRRKLFARQGGLCHWCRKPMRLVERLPAKVKEVMRDLCTLDHLDDRWSQERGSHGGEFRIVAACWQCNFDRNVERERSLPRQALWAASGAYPRSMRDGNGGEHEVQEEAD